MRKLWGHFRTITRHRHLVMGYCFRVGLYWRGLIHDLSKYSPAEFLAGARFYQDGRRSPNAAEREFYGVSHAWMHHKGRNRHHYEYWFDVDLRTHRYTPVEMPAEYLVESVMDRIAACRIYRGKDYTDGAALDYLERADTEEYLFHPATLAKLRFLLTMLRDRGEGETFRFIREVVLKKEDFLPKDTD